MTAASHPFCRLCGRPEHGSVACGFLDQLEPTRAPTAPPPCECESLRASLAQAGRELSEKEAESTRERAESEAAGLREKLREALDRFDIDYYQEEGEPESEACRMAPSNLADAVRALLAAAPPKAREDETPPEGAQHRWVDANDVVKWPHCGVCGGSRCAELPCAMGACNHDGVKGSNCPDCPACAPKESAPWRPKVGERVRVCAKYPDDTQKDLRQYEGLVGEVERVQGNVSFPVYVRFNAEQMCPFRLDELEPAPGPECGTCKGTGRVVFHRDDCAYSMHPTPQRCIASKGTCDRGCTVYEGPCPKCAAPGDEGKSNGGAS